MAGVAQILAKCSCRGGDVKIYDKNRNAIKIADRCHGKVVAFYFSASWCPPCLKFTPLISRFYEKYNKSKRFEVIFVTSDKDPQKAYDYYMHMPFWRLSFQDVECKNNLKERFNVQSIPRLVLVHGDSGEVINLNAVPRLLNDDREGFQFPWREKLIERQAQAVGGGECRLGDDIKHITMFR